MLNVRGSRENQKASSRESLEKFHKVELAAKRRERIAQGVRGCCPTRESQLPSSAEEGKADAVAAAGVVLVKKIILISTTPSARAKVASQLFLCRAATPPRLRRGAYVRTLGNSPVSPGSGINLGQSPEGATDLCRPFGAFSQLALIPRANALGYALSPLRGCLTG